MPAISAAPSLGVPIPPAAAIAAGPPPAPTADDAKKLLPVANNPLLPGSTASQPDVRQILSQIMVILQSLMGSLGNGGAPGTLPPASSVLPTSLSIGAADAAGAGNAGNAANCPVEGAAGGAGAGAAAPPAAKPAAPAAPAPAAPAPVPVAAPAPAPAPAPVPTPAAAPAPVMPAGLPSIGLGGFTGVNNLTISGLPPTPTLPQAPTSFFTPIATPGVPVPGAPAPAAPAPAPAPAAGAPPAAKIALTSGEELQQRIQAFNRANPNNLQGLAQFLTGSYNNTSQFVLQPDGNLLYGVAGKTFVIAATGLTPRQEVAVPPPPPPAA